MDAPKTSIADNPPALSALPHRLAVATAAVAFFLLFMGGMVTSTGSGDAEPVWPFAAFRAAWDWWIEMGHRYVGWLVGLLTVVLTAVLVRGDDRPWVRTLAWIALAGVVVQGGLGGLRIAFPEDKFPAQRAAVAIVHTCVGQAFFCLLIALALFTSRSWRTAEPVDDDDTGHTVRKLAIALPIGTFLQIVLGALVRHVHTGLAVGLHVTMALVVAGLAAIVVMIVLSRYPGITRLASAAGILGGLLVAQLTLGIWSYIRFDPKGRSVEAGAIVPTLHVLVGVLCLAASLVLVFWLYRLLRPVAFPVKPTHAVEAAA